MAARFPSLNTEDFERILKEKDALNTSKECETGNATSLILPNHHSCLCVVGEEGQEFVNHINRYRRNAKEHIVGVVKLGFLGKAPEEWPEDEDYQEGKRLIGGLKVVNNSAERGVALVQQFNDGITIHEDQKQYLLQVVEYHRKQHPTVKHILSTL